MAESERPSREAIHLNHRHVIDILGLCKAASTASTDEQNIKLLKNAAETITSTLTKEHDAQFEFPSMQDRDKLVEWRLENRAAALEAKGMVGNLKKTLEKMEVELSKYSDEGDLIEQDLALEGVDDGLGEIHMLVSKKGKLSDLQTKRPAEMDDETREFENLVDRYRVNNNIKRRRTSKD